MRKKTVRLGLNLVTAGIMLVIAATFFHERLGALLFLSAEAEMRFVYLSLFWGSAAGCAGIMVAAIGMLRTDAGLPRVYLAPSLIMLTAAVVLFFLLLLSSLQAPEHPRLRPGQTIII